MKAPPFIFLMLIHLAFVSRLESQNIISISFTAITDGLYQPLDSVVVENLSQGGDTVLYYPDTMLVLDHGTAVPYPPDRPNEEMIIYPAFPNPFTSHTTIKFSLSESDQVMLRVVDLLGRNVTTHKQFLPMGEHTFTLYPGSERYYMLVIETSSHQHAQKLHHTGDRGGVFRIENTGHQPIFSGFRLGKSGFSWFPGDQLRFAGGVTLTGNVAKIDTLLDEPLFTSVYTFQYTGMYAPGYVHCVPVMPTVVVDVINPVTGKTWMDRNLGAYLVAISSTDANAYGDMYQWGRYADGHQCRNSSTSNTLSTNDQPGHGMFILGVTTPSDWRTPQNHNLWQGVDGINNPCPAGYRIPSSAELDDERLSWIPNNANGAFLSPLKLTVGGNRVTHTGLIANVGAYGYYWSSTVSGTYATRLGISPYPMMSNTLRASGFSVRCIKE